MSLSVSSGRIIANQILSLPSFSRTTLAVLKVAGKRHLARRIAMKGRCKLPELIEEPLPSWLSSRPLRMKICGGRAQIALTVWARGWAYYERPLPVLFSRLAKQSHTVLDIGANTGFYSLLAGHAAAKVLAFEPVPSVADVLERNIWLNGLTNVSLFRCAISDSPGKVKLFMPKADDRFIERGASLNPEIGLVTSEAIERAFNVNLDHNEFGAAIDVEARTVDQVSGGHQVDLIKIDVETLEEKVLNGARGTIARCRPIISIEVSNNSPLAQWGGDIGYTSVACGSRASFIQDIYNHLLCPEERMAELSSVAKKTGLVLG